MKLINLYGGPGTSKSTSAAYIFAKLKELGINCELISEYAKSKCWEDNFTPLKCQPYVIGKQMYAQFKLLDKVDVGITDSPILFGIVYAGFGNTPSWSSCVKEWFGLFDNINIFLLRNSKVHPYNPKGRMQTEKEAEQLDIQIMQMLTNNNIPFHIIEVDHLENLWQRVKEILIKEGVINA